MKINLGIFKWWQILILILLIFGIIYVFNNDKKPYNFIGLDDKQKTNIYINEKFNKNIKYKCEEICRNTLQDIYKVQFNKARPEWLRNPETGKCLELDCYNENLKIACEYNGEQHYIFPNRWFKYKWEFNKQIERDILKKKLCNNYGIYLITVPYTISNNNIALYIIDELKKNNKYPSYLL